MHIKRVLLILMLVAVTVALTVSTTQASSQSTANFGPLMKPGWVGGNNSTNTTTVLVLRCALFNSAMARTNLPDAEVTRTGKCAAWPVAGLFNHRDYIDIGGVANGYPTRTVTYNGVTDFIPLRPH